MYQKVLHHISSFLYLKCDDVCVLVYAYLKFIFGLTNILFVTFGAVEQVHTVAGFMGQRPGELEYFLGKSTDH